VSESVCVCIKDAFKWFLPPQALCFTRNELSFSLSHSRALLHTCRGRIVSELELGGFSTMESLQSFDHKVFCGDLNYRCSREFFWE
jgi:hypothetical protein